ncbi:MAG: type III pantothenate kinase [Clostridium sp.]|jgi:type III pantothenate kinase|nr:type III pantothenate kinase [Clostridium sp.]
MILVIDVGNTNLTYGVYEGQTLRATFRMMTKTPRTSDEYGILILQLLSNKQIKGREIEGVIIASVVPDVMHSLTGGLIRYIGRQPLNVGPGVKTGIKVVTENPRAIGADRIVDAVAAYEKYGGPVLVLDFGTATTYDLVTADGNFAAGITAPGIRISSEALWKQTAKLPNIEIKKPKSILAQETISSMQAGLVYGQIGQTEYIIRKVREESGLKDLKVVATGGLGRLIAEETDSIDVYDAALTLDGLRLVYEKNHKQQEWCRWKEAERNP